MHTINDSIVKKAWGYEHIVYRNKHLAIWFLKINHNEETSLHAHPNKNTGLIVLDGIAKISFLNNSLMLKGIDKTNIFARRFHSTKAITEKGVSILEVEAPEDKQDLVRLSDKYGRENQPYEGSENYIPLTNDCLQLKNEQIIYKHSNCVFCIENIKNKEQLLNRKFEEVLVVIDGGIETKDKKKICVPGDVIASHNLDILLKSFDIIDGTKVLSIIRDE